MNIESGRVSLYNEVAKKDKLNYFLNDLWMDMMDDYPKNRERLMGALLLAVDLGLISTMEQEMWALAVNVCPDKYHIGGRVWCAYCGEVEPDYDGN